LFSYKVKQCLIATVLQVNDYFVQCCLTMFFMKCITFVIRFFKYLCIHVYPQVKNPWTLALAFLNFPLEGFSPAKNYKK